MIQVALEAFPRSPRSGWQWFVAVFLRCVVYSRDIALHSVETWRGETVDATPPPSVEVGFIFCGVNCLGEGRLDWIGRIVLKRSF